MCKTDCQFNSVCSVCSVFAHLCVFCFRLIRFAVFMCAHLLVLQSLAMVNQPNSDGQSVSSSD